MLFFTGKSWGDARNEIVLVFHGMQDNAGSFNGLIPYLPDFYCYKAFDLPGHGKSSHFPPGLFYHTVDNLLVYKIIVDYFKQGSYVFIGHSYGAQIALAFAQLYPGCAKKIVLLDTFSLFPIQRDYYKNFYTRTIEKHLDLEKKYKTRQQPVYTYDQAFEKLMVGRAFGDVTKKAAEDLFERATVKVGDNQYKFTADQRLKQFINPQNDMRQLVGLFRKYPVTCPLLFVLGSESRFQYSYFQPILTELKKNKICIIKILDGNHNVHMNSPEVVGPIVHNFLVKRKNKL